MKKAFSLIEIMQTVVLLGIIAGLSISFFKKINSDQKFFNSTVTQLNKTIKQVGREMCSDSTPICVFTVAGGAGQRYYKFDDLINMDIPLTNGTQYNNVWNCQYIYGNDVDAQTVDGYCKANNALTDCNTINNAKNSNPNAPGDVAGKYHPDMIKGSDGKCYAAPPCPTQQVVNTIPTWQAVPLNTFICPNGEPDFTPDVGIYNRENNIDYPAFCTYFHKIVSHKLQGQNEAQDLNKTCGESSTIFDGASMPAAISNRKAIAENSGIRRGRDNYNMLLPNGVYLYNLNNGPNSIFIKYDRVPGVDSAFYDINDIKSTTMRVYSYAQGGEKTTLDYAENWAWDNDDLSQINSQDKEKCPNGGLYLGLDEDGKTNKCSHRSNDDKTNCPVGGIYTCSEGSDPPVCNCYDRFNPGVTIPQSSNTTTTTTTTITDGQ